MIYLIIIILGIHIGFLVFSLYSSYKGKYISIKRNSYVFVNKQHWYLLPTVDVCKYVTVIEIAIRFLCITYYISYSIDYDIE